MKKIGLLTAWASEDWIEISIKQALELVDELIINIGPYNKYFKRIKDNTLKIAKKFSTNNKIKFISTVYETKELINTYRKNRCATLNRMLQASENIEKGNIIWLLDADEFYNKEAIKEINEFLKSNSDFDQIYLVSRFFCINTNHYITVNHNRIFKIKNKNTFFTPTQFLNPRPKKTVILLKDNPMFHYSLLTGDQIRCIFWLCEEKFKRLIWYFKIYKKFEFSKEEYWMKKNQEVTGNYGFFFHKSGVVDPSITEKNGHGLFKYNGKHPDIIESSPLRLISDFREYMRKKPNYPIYLETMKEIIAIKKRFNFQRWVKKKKIKIKKSLKKKGFINNHFKNKIKKISSLFSNIW